MLRNKIVDIFSMETKPRWGWMPLSPTPSKSAKLVVLTSQEAGEGIHDGSSHYRRRFDKERVPGTRGGGRRFGRIPQEGDELAVILVHGKRCGWPVYSWAA
jgi:hypothetical protein